MDYKVCMNRDRWIALKCYLDLLADECTDERTQQKLYNLIEELDNDVQYIY